MNNTRTNENEMNEESADWCVIAGNMSVCGTNMREHSRKSEGIKWCFHCRKRHEFFLVVSVPDGFSYYGPRISVEGPYTECSDLFPGWEREYDE